MEKNDFVVGVSVSGIRPVAAPVADPERKRAERVLSVGFKSGSMAEEIAAVCSGDFR